MTTDLLTRPGARLRTPEAGLEILDGATRREFLAGLAAAGLLAACGGDGEGGNTTPSGAGRGTITVEHAGGTTEVPVAPGRIVTLDGYVDLQTLLVLGVDPVLAGVRASVADGLLAGRLGGIGEIADRGVENLERIAVARPDLIISAEYDVDRYDDLSAIAPSVLVDRYGATVDDHLRLIGRVVDRGDEAEAAIAAFAQRLADVEGIVAASPLADLTVVGVDSLFGGGNVRAYGPRSYGGRTLDAVGVEVLDPGGESDGDDFAFGGDLSPEQLGALEPADLIVLYTSPDAEGFEPVEDQPLWPTLPAVAAGRVIEVDTDVWYQDTALSRLVRLDDIERIARELG